MARRWAAGLAATACTAAALGAHAQDAPAPQDQPADGARQAAVVVTGRAQALYRVEETVTGKLPTEPLTSSQTIAVITEELIEDQGARDAQDLYRNISGVSFFSYAGVTARGFRQQEIFYDNLRGDPYAGFSVPQLFNVARVEFLKGPAGMLYGAGAPGGLFNYVTKKPSDEFSAEVAGVYGTEGQKGGSFEVTGALPLAGAAGRLGAFYETRNGPRRVAGSDIAIYDAGLSFDLGFADLVVQATRYEQDLAGNRLRGVPVDNLGNFLADRRWNHNEPTDFLDLEANVYQAQITAEPTDSLRLDAALRRGEGVESQQYHEPFGLFDTNSDGVVDASRRQYRDQIRETENWSFAANAVWSAELGPVSNRVLAGFDWFASDGLFDGRSVNGNNTPTAGRPGPLSLANPVYGLSNPRAYVLPAFTRSLTEQNQTGGYLLNEATLGDWVATFGARADSFEDVAGTTSFEDEAVSLRAGLVWRVRPDVSLYAQWAESFEPQGIASQTPLAGGPFPPTEGESVEGGLRTELYGGRLQSTLAVYEIVRTNILQADPRGDVGNDGVNDFVAFGEVTSQGFEVDLAADLTDDWVLTATYAWNDTRITATNGRTAITNSVGDRFANAPEHTIGFWTRYQVRPLNLAVALGGDYVDVRRSLDNQKVRPYTVFDASLIWETRDWRALLRVDNLTDETYAASGFIARTGHFPGDPRSVFVELARRW